ncbi:ribosome-inactivating family protein [Streptomyces sp. NPDC046887]|uniref:ribosome-inactivating family protein n=1 Tax=Streptomyces sp. NPDC046887 TaxID=3155472 RepID=UPI0033C2DFCF
MKLPYPLRRLVRGRRLTGLGLAFVMALSMVGLTAPVSHADPKQPLTEIHWNITGLEGGGQAAHDEYWRVIDQLHHHTGHDFHQTQLDETTGLSNRLVQISLHHKGAYVGALYFWADNLYLAGIYQPGQGGGHFAFRDQRPADFNAVLGVHSEPLPWNGSYIALPGGSTRQNLQINGPRLHGAMMNLAGARRLISHGAGQDLLGQSLVMMIQATAEAARFGRVFDNIRGNIRTAGSGGAQLGVENVDLQQNWSRISNWVYRVIQNPAAGELSFGSGVFHRSFRTLQQLLAYVFFMELHSGSR